MGRARSNRHKEHPYPTRNKKLARLLGTREYSESHTAVIGIPSMVDPRHFEKVSEHTVRFRDGGYVTYKGIIAGRRKGIEALISPEMIRAGSSARYDFPFLTRKTGMFIIRGHLLARVLGGSGYDPCNLVPLYHARNNLPMFQDIEKVVMKYVEAGGMVRYIVTPEYRGRSHPSSHMSVFPTSLRIQATKVDLRAPVMGASLLSHNPAIFYTGL